MLLFWRKRNAREFGVSEYFAAVHAIQSVWGRRPSGCGLDESCVTGRKVRADRRANNRSRSCEREF